MVATHAIAGRRQWTPFKAAVAPIVLCDAAAPGTISLSGGFVASWANLGTYGGVFTQATVGQQPTYSASDLGYPGVRFNASTQPQSLVRAVPSTPAAMEFWFVFQKDADPPASTQVAGFVDFTGDGSGTGTSHVPYTDGVIYDGMGSTLRKTTVNPTPALTAQHAYSVVSTATEWTSYLDAVQLYTTASNVVGLPASNLVIGARAGGFIGMQGVFREVIVFPVKLSTADRANMHAYCQTKWGTP